MPNPTLPPEAGEVIDLPESVVTILTNVVLAAFDGIADCDVGLDEIRDSLAEIEWPAELAPHFQALVLAEREACAKVAEDWAVLGWLGQNEAICQAANSIAAAIRGRSILQEGK